MRTNTERQKVLEYHNKGLSQNEISKLCNIPRSTISGWIKSPNKKNIEFDPYEYIIKNNLQKTYSYILGLYLGDGYIDKMPRTWRFRVFNAKTYVELNNHIERELKKIFPLNKVNRVDSNTYYSIYVYSKNIPLLFPHYGEGKKHQRKINLLEWQKKIIIPKYFIKGLFHSDGSYYPRTDKRSGKISWSYDFRNESDDILKFFKMYCNEIGIKCTFSSKPKCIHVYRKEYVEKLKKLIGTKTNL